MIKVALVGCGKRKRPGEHEARNLYSGALFQKSLAYAERTHVDVFILSARHGLLSRDEVVQWYDARLSTARDDQQAWAIKVGSQLIDRYTKCRLDLFVLAGAAYVEPLRWYVERTRGRWTIRAPMQGRQVGERLRWLNQELRRGTTPAS